MGVFIGLADVIIQYVEISELNEALLTSGFYLHDYNNYFNKFMFYYYEV